MVEIPILPKHYCTCREHKSINGDPSMHAVNRINETLDVALVHDWLPVLGGAEKVVEQMVRVFPQATIYTLFDFLSPEERAQVSLGRPIETSRLNRWPGVEKYYRYLILQSTRAIEEFNVTHHDLVLSSSAALSKGVLTSPEQLHICYMHSPARYAWDLTHEYIGGIGGAGAWLKQKIAREMMYRFRLWDMRSTPQIDHLIANSEFIKKRIWKTYRREATVIYPPVDTDAFTISEKPREDFYFTASRMVPYKQIQLIVETFKERPDLRLIVSGDGPEMPRIQAAAGPNVTFLGHASFEVMRDHMQRAKAFVFAAKEDFGIVPVEAQACGTPVIALSHGGTAETVRGLADAQPTGVHFDEQTVPSLLKAIEALEANTSGFSEDSIAAHARSFASDRFRRELSEFVSSVS